MNSILVVELVPTGTAQKPKASNLSPEMKAKLKAEYLGLGGSENKVGDDESHLVVGRPQW